MKKTLHIAICIIALIMSACNGSQQKREEFIRTYLQKYPEATLQDIYKGSFQDVFGPAHMLTDRTEVENYIQYEINHADTLSGDEYEPCSWQGRFYRVNLSVVKEGKVPMDVFVDAFMQSANGIDTTLTSAWLEEWKLILQGVKAEVPHLKHFAEDSLAISQLLEKGQYVVHHSKVFDETYRPHYRIIRKDLFEEHILPRLK